MLRKTLQFFADELNKYLILKKVFTFSPRLITASGIASVCHAETYTGPDPNDNDKKEMISICSIAFLTFQLLPYDTNSA